MSDEAFDWEAHRAFNQQLIDEYRANGGTVGGAFANSELLLLTTTGAKSDRKHTVPLGYGIDGDTVFVVASKGGMPTHPAWYHNVLADPAVTVELGTDSFAARAVVADESERQRLFAQIATVKPVFAEYQSKTERPLPIVRLERVG